MSVNLTRMLTKDEGTDPWDPIIDQAASSSYCVKVTDCCMWMVSDEAVPYVDVVVFSISVVVLWLSMDLGCQLCVFGILVVSLFFCCRYRYMFFTLWAAVIVLWLHGWRFGGGKGFSVQWN